MNEIILKCETEGFMKAAKYWLVKPAFISLLRSICLAERIPPQQEVKGLSDLSRINVDPNNCLVEFQEQGFEMIEALIKKLIIIDRIHDPELHDLIEEIRSICEEVFWTKYCKIDVMAPSTFEENIGYFVPCFVTLLSLQGLFPPQCLFSNPQEGLLYRDKSQFCEHTIFKLYMSVSMRIA